MHSTDLRTKKLTDFLVNLRGYPEDTVACAFLVEAKKPLGDQKALEKHISQAIAQAAVT